MNLIAAIFVVLLFIVLLFALGLVERARDVVAIARESARIMGDTALTDDDKEAAIQKNALRMMKLAGALLFGFAITLLAPIGLVWVVGLTGLVSLDATIGILLRWDFMVAATVVGIAAYYLYVGLKK